MRGMARAERASVDRWGARVLAVVLALAVCAPLLGPGYSLVRDMVFVPDPVLSVRSWGGDGSVPRAVPGDAVVALLARLLPVPVIQQSALLAAVGVAALGAWRVSPARTIPGAAMSATAFAWTPYAAERLAMGHWSLLLGVALLPWVVLLATRPERPEWIGLLALVGLAVAAAPTSAVLVTVPALVLGALNRRWSGKNRWLLLIGSLALNAAWILPGLRAAARLVADPVGVAAFAPRSDTDLGTVVSVVTGGGMWNTLVHLGSRDLPLPVLLATAVAVAGAVGWFLAPGADLARSWPVLALGLLGLALPLLATTHLGQEALTWVTAQVPGGGLLRDSQKWLAWWLLTVAWGLPVTVERLMDRLATGEALALGLGVACLPLLCLPDFAWGVAGRVERTEWPVQFQAVADELNSAPDDGAALVLPWHALRSWSWNDDRTVLDPWQRMLDRPVVWRDDLELTDGTVPGEDPTAAAVTELVGLGPLRAEDLRDLGISWVVEDLRTATVDTTRAPAGEVVVDGPDVRLTHLGAGDEVRPVAPAGWLAWVQMTGLVILLASACWKCAHLARRLLRFGESKRDEGNNHGE